MIVSFLMLFYLSKNTFKKGSVPEALSLLIKNLLNDFASLPVVEDVLATFDASVSTEDEKMATYQLMIVSKNVHYYFANLLEDTQRALHHQDFGAAVSAENSVARGSLIGRAKLVMARHLEEHSDLLGFVIYNEDGKKLFGLKYKNIPNYNYTEKLKKEVEKRSNLLLRHTDSENLVLISKVEMNQKKTFYVTQTLHPLFFTRILEQLEVADKLFYIKNESDILLDNFGGANYATYEKTKEMNVAGKFYQALIEKKDKSISIKQDNVSLLVGMEVTQNNFLGDTFAILFLALIVGGNFYGIIFLSGVLLGARKARVEEESIAEGLSVNAKPISGNSD